jgi:flagellar biosynthetic protein FliQ
MSQAGIVSILRDALSTALTMAAPFLAVSVGIGIVVSVVQAATQIHEQNVGFVFKILAIALVLIVLGSWLISHSTDLITRTFAAIDAMN